MGEDRPTAGEHADPSPGAAPTGTGDRRALGEKMRRQVLSDAYVDGRRAATTPLGRDLEEIITGFAWGEVWSRPGLDLRTRSVVTLVLAASRSQWDEFRVHVRGALNNGLSRDELKEVLIHAAVYGGFPVARTGIKEAQAVLDALDAERQGRGSGDQRP